MKGLKVLEALEDGPKTIEDIVAMTKLKKMEVRRYLLRFVEQGKVEAFQEGEKMFWKLREESEVEREFRYV